MTTQTSTFIDRDEAIKRIRAALRRRSIRTWSVTGGNGTSYGYITIRAPPARRNEYGYTSEDDRSELAELLGLESVHHQGLMVSPDERLECLRRCEG